MPCAARTCVRTHHKGREEEHRNKRSKPCVRDQALGIRKAVLHCCNWLLARREAHQNSRWHACQTQHIGGKKVKAPVTARTAPRATRYSNCSPALFIFNAACSRAVGPAGPCLFGGMPPMDDDAPSPLCGFRAFFSPTVAQKKTRGKKHCVISKPSPPAIEEERGRRRNGGGRACGANGGEQRCCCVEKIGAVASRMLVVNIAASSPLFPLGSHCRM